MKIKVVGVSFRNLQLNIPVGSSLEVIKDPLGVKTLQSHTDENALSLWLGGDFVGYVPKDLNQNHFKSVKVSQVWYKEYLEGSQPVGAEYIEGCYVAGVEIDCEGDFQITKEDGRTYETDGKEYESITSFLKKYPTSPEHLITWALTNYSSPDEYRDGLGKLAQKGTELHNDIENYLKLKKSNEGNKSLPICKGKKQNYAFGELNQNVQNFFNSLGDFEVISIEERCYSDDLSLAGTCDAVLRIKERLIAFDWKSSAKPQNKQKVQSGFYGYCNDCDLACVVCFGAKNKQGYSVSKVDCKASYDILRQLKKVQEMERNLTYKN